MRIAYMLGTLNRGGAETLVLDIANNCRAKGLDITLIHRGVGLLLDDFERSGIPMTRIWPSSLLDLGYFARLRSFMKSESISIAHTHQVIDMLYVYIATFGLATKVVLSFHGHGLNNSLFSRLMRKCAIGHTDLNLFVSKSQKDYYAERFPIARTGVVLPNGIDFKKLLNHSDWSLRKELKMADSELLIGTVGNFTSGRDQLFLCRSLLKFQQSGIPFKFVFVGAASRSEPDLYTNCVRFCSDNGLLDSVYFLGTRSDVPSILIQLTAFVYSSVHDTFGIAVIEAIAAGIPVFVNDWRVMNEITREGQLATVYRSGDEEDLLQRFTHFYGKQTVYQQRAKLNAKIVKEQYGMDGYLARLKTIYKSIL